jgi:hypothetical protein
MKAILEFDLSNPEEEYAHRRCMDSSKMASVLFEITHNLKRKWKHSENQPDLEEVFQEIHNLIDEYGINIDELMA